jgi:hypothetical protein
MMVYLRTKEIKGKKYYYLVKGIRENGKVKQKVIYYIGTAETLLKKLRAADAALRKD